MMKAVRMHAYGSPEVLRYEEVPQPRPGAGELLIRTLAAGVNPLDWKLRSGYSKLWPPHTPPVILGFDVAGIVEEVGEGVERFGVGDEIYVSPDMGGYAEYVVVEEGWAAHKPRTVDFVQAASMPVAALTAWHALIDTAQLEAGQTVLVHGAAGGVGTFAVQLAKWRGAQVIGTASTHNLDFLRQLGADVVVDYTTTPFEKVAHGVDLVLDIVGGDTLQRSWSVIQPGGKVISLVNVIKPETAEAHGAQYVKYELELRAGDKLAELAALVDAGQIKPIVSTVFPLQEAAKAHRLSESRHVRGKIVLQVDADMR